MAPAVIVTCEHGGNRVPARWSASFRGERARLASHRGWDPGAARVARVLSRELGAPLVVATVTRLLVDLNRSEGHPRLFSEVTRALPRSERNVILVRHYRPHRGRVEELVAAAARGGPVLHVAVHSFTPVLDGVVRDADVGLLYDPRSRGERALALAWQEALRDAGLAVRRNYPYRGAADGLTTALRRAHPAPRYLGFEVELNQALLAATSAPRSLGRLLAATLVQALGGPPRARRGQVW